VTSQIGIDGLDQPPAQSPDLAAGRNPAELLAIAERICAMSPALPEGARFPTAEELIREDRDSR